MKNKYYRIVKKYGYLSFSVVTACILSVSLAAAQSFTLPANPSKNYPTAAVHYAYYNTFVFNPRKLRWVAYGANGQPIKSGIASGGSNYCRDLGRPCHTRPGVYSIHAKGGAGCKSSRYPLGRGGSPMPYCAFFHGNYAIHGSYELPHHNASHGCIRITPAAAKWLSHNFFRIGTRVIVLPY